MLYLKLNQLPWKCIDTNTRNIASCHLNGQILKLKKVNISSGVITFQRYKQVYIEFKNPQLSIEK